MLWSQIISRVKWGWNKFMGYRSISDRCTWPSRHSLWVQGILIPLVVGSWKGNLLFLRVCPEASIATPTGDTRWGEADRSWAGQQIWPRPSYTDCPWEDHRSPKAPAGWRVGGNTGEKRWSDSHKGQGEEAGFQQSPASILFTRAPVFSFYAN